MRTAYCPPSCSWLLASPPSVSSLFAQNPQCAGYIGDAPNVLLRAGVDAMKAFPSARQAAHQRRETR